MNPLDNKFHKGNGADGKHYWLTPPDLMQELNSEFYFDFDPCPFPKPEEFDGLTSPWARSNYVNPPFGSVIGADGKKKGPTAWVRKCIEEKGRGNKSVMVFPLDKWVLMMIQHCSEIRNLGDVKWVATEDGVTGKGLGRHIGCFILDPSKPTIPEMGKEITKLKEALREAVEHMDCRCGTEYSCSMCRFREKHAAIIAEITKGEA